VGDDRSYGRRQADSCAIRAPGGALPRILVPLSDPIHFRLLKTSSPCQRMSRRERGLAVIVLDQSNLDPWSAQHVTSRANPKFHEVNNIPPKVSGPKCFSYRSTHTLSLRHSPAERRSGLSSVRWIRGARSGLAPRLQHIQGLILDLGPIARAISKSRKVRYTLVIGPLITSYMSFSTPRIPKMITRNNWVP
jgi:hypothetical protein